MKIKFIVLTCEKYLKSRGKSILETWGKNQNITFLSDKNGRDNIISFDNLSSDYSEMWNRYYEYIKNNSNEDDWICFTDDDTHINIENLRKTLSLYSPDKDLYLGKKLFLSERATDMDGNYTGFPLNSLVGEKCTLPLYYASGGAGFVISKSTFTKLKKYVTEFINIPRCFNTDVTFGMWMKNCEIPLIDNKFFNSTNPTSLNHSSIDIINSISYHYVSPDTMAQINVLINEKI